MDSTTRTNLNESSVVNAAIPKTEQNQTEVVDLVIRTAQNNAAVSALYEAKNNDVEPSKPASSSAFRVLSWLLFSVATFLIGLAIWKTPDKKIEISILAVALLIGFVLAKLPKWQVSKLRGLKQAELFDKENEARKTVAQIIGGILVLAGLYYTQNNIKITQDEAERGRKLTREGQITDRFTKAITQLGDSKIEVRLGGIYALERIARDSEVDRSAIFEILAAYVRENASVEKARTNEKKEADELKENEYIEEFREIKPSTDIQAALNVIGRRQWIANEQNGISFDLHGISIMSADLMGLNFERAYLGLSNLSFVDFREANLKGANFQFSDLTNVNFGNANLEGVNFEGCSLRWRDLVGAKTLYRAHFSSSADVDFEKEIRTAGYGHLLDNQVNP